MTAKQEGDFVAPPPQSEQSAKQPTPNEIAQLAITLAQTRESITSGNREKLLGDAYELFRKFRF